MEQDDPLLGAVPLRGCAQDMEWALVSRDGAGDSVYLLQSRPETVWSRREAEALLKPRAKAFEHVFAVLSGSRKP